MDYKNDHNFDAPSMLHSFRRTMPRPSQISSKGQLEGATSLTCMRITIMHPSDSCFEDTAVIMSYRYIDK